MIRPAPLPLLLLLSLQLISLPAAAGAQESADSTEPTPTTVLYSRVAPLELKIPSLGVQAEVVAVTEDEDGAMSAPENPDTVAWYSLGPGIGESGNVVLAGHVDLGGRLRVFGFLHTLREGDELYVVDELAREYRYEVIWYRSVPSDGADIASIFGSSDQAEITLITCTGAFDPATRQYQDRLIVRAVRG